MYRIGQSTDIHPLASGRPLVLGGVLIESDKGLVGHSDADVLTHVIAEAILGALALKDLGTHFPDTDESYKDANSLDLLKKVVTMMQECHYEIVNVDSLIIIERPKLAPYLEEMKTNLCHILKIDKTQLNVKATRGEKLGFIGHEEGAVGQAVVLLRKEVSDEPKKT